MGYGKLQENSREKTQEQKPLCDLCAESVALLYWRADSAKLCLYCDRPKFTPPISSSPSTPVPCSDACDSSPSSIFFSTHCSVLCQNCDWESHSLSLSSVHDRRPLEGFNGCPSVAEFSANNGFDEFGKKKKKKGLFDCDGDVGFEGSENYGFSDYLIWETPSVVSLDDKWLLLMEAHNFQVLGIPPLPKNRNTVCGQRKEDLRCQLRVMAKLEPNFDDDKRDLEPPSWLWSLVPEQNCQQLDTCTGFEHKAEPIFFPSYEASAFLWCSDTGEDADQGLPTPSFRSYFNPNCLVPDKDSEIGHSLHNGNNDHEAQPHNLFITEASQICPKVASHELSSQDRGSAITRYKEKRKSRRYDKHIRYESRKVHTKSRTRIKGRFVKDGSLKLCV